MKLVLNKPHYRDLIDKFTLIECESVEQARVLIQASLDKFYQDAPNEFTNSQWMAWLKNTGFSRSDLFSQMSFDLNGVAVYYFDFFGFEEVPGRISHHPLFFLRPLPFTVMTLADWFDRCYTGIRLSNNLNSLVDTSTNKE